MTQFTCIENAADWLSVKLLCKLQAADIGGWRVSVGACAWTASGSDVISWSPLRTR